MSPPVLFAMMRTRREAFPFYLSRRYFGNSIGSVKNSVTIGDVTVDDPPRGDSPHLIPDLLRFSGFHEVNSSLPPCHVSHLRWMLQKDLVLGQDFLLLGTPNLARERWVSVMLVWACSNCTFIYWHHVCTYSNNWFRRQLLLLYATLLGREIEWISITKDTSEADLKQRKEVFSNRTRYVNQAPVRAALNGRLLILDGLEKAERKWVGRVQLTS